MSIPILIVAYDRPKITKALLLRIKSLPPTQVFISIDRANKESSRFKANLDVISLCEEFSLDSYHKTTIFTQQENVGCNANTIFGMRMLLSGYDSGLLLEDDCEFRDEYIDFLNSNYMNIDYSKYMSVTPMNPDWDKDLYNLKSEKVEVRYSPIMGASLGMTFSRESIRTFDLVLQNLNSDELQERIKQALRRAEINFMQREILEDFWNYKVFKIKQTFRLDVEKFTSSTSHQSQSGWDAVWQLGAFFEQKDFLLTSYTVARESLNQSESGWHPHTFSYPSWNDLSLNFQIDSIERGQQFYLLNWRKFDALSISNWPVLKYFKIYASRTLFKLRTRKHL